MILYGRDLSPFVRRISIWCALQGRAVERRPITVMGEDFAKLKAMNPVARVPVLELDDGTRLIDSYAIGDWLDETAPNGVRLVPAGGVPRREALQRLAVAAGVADKAVALVYERNRRPEELHWKDWQGRVVDQVRSGLGALDAAVPEAGWSGGGAPDSGPAAGPDAGDVSAVCAYQFLAATTPWVLEPGYPRLAGFVERAMQLPAVAATKPAPV
jgi:glutathione S-transferase